MVLVLLVDLVCILSPSLFKVSIFILNIYSTGIANIDLPFPIMLFSKNASSDDLVTTGIQPLLPIYPGTQPQSLDYPPGAAANVIFGVHADISLPELLSAGDCPNDWRKVELKLASVVNAVRLTETSVVGSAALAL